MPMNSNKKLKCQNVSFFNTDRILHVVDKFNFARFNFNRYFERLDNSYYCITVFDLVSANALTSLYTKGKFTHYVNF